MHRMTRIAALALVVVSIVLAATAIGLARKPSVAAPIPVLTDVGRTERTPAVTVIVAARDLHAGHPIGAEDVTTTRAGDRPAGALPSEDAAVGKVLLRDVAAGTPLAVDDLARGIAASLRVGERAVAVPVDELSGVGHRIAPGDLVDVFVHLRLGERGEERRQTRLLLSRLRVLGYGGDDLAPAPAREDETAFDDDPRAAAIAASAGTSATSRRRETTAARSAILAIPVDQVQRLLLASQQGALSLALRHPADTAVADADLFPQPRRVLSARRDLQPDDRDALARPENIAYAGTDLDALAGSAAAAPPPPRPAERPRTASIEIIRGDGRQSGGTR